MPLKLPLLFDFGTMLLHLGSEQFFAVPVALADTLLKAHQTIQLDQVSVGVDRESS